MAELGAAHVQCPACEAPIVLPLTQAGADLMSITLAIDLSAVRTHIATEHPQENPMSALTDKLHAFFARFTSVAHQDVQEIVTAVEQHLAPLVQAAVRDALTTVEADGKSLLDKLKTDEEALVKAVAAEVAKLLGRTPDPAPQGHEDPAPAEPPAAS
ncbi:hypothetical protein ACH40F_07795 [Streptomyces sp. NPDC020794]|uniref:hypothetical protein n=1 Tax=unclassified Streptomyces TaxID=2593676 RepID=UPI0036EA7E82